MKIYLSVIIILLSGLSTVCHGQNKCAVIKAYPFYKIHSPGNIKVDEKGKPLKQAPNIERFIYIESNGAARPVVKAILYDTILFKTIITRVPEQKLVAGKKVNDQQDFILSAKKGNTLWKIELQYAQENVLVKEDCKNIIIKSIYAGKLCKLYCTKEIALTARPQY